jgi:hypothetical protein
MAKQTHYSPQLSRLNVCALYHEAKSKGVPMTKLADELLAKALADSESWTKAEQQLREETPPYRTE